MEALVDAWLNFQVVMVNCRGIWSRFSGFSRAEAVSPVRAPGIAARGSKIVTSSIQRQPNPLLKGSFPILVFFLFAIFSACVESVPFVAKVRPQLILAVLGLLAVLATGQFAKALKTPIGKCIAIFTVWFIACIPFGSWPGGSFGVFTEYWYKSALIYFLAAGLLTTLPQANRLYHTIAYAVFVLSLLTLLKNNRTNEGRLILDNTRYANPNDLAWTLLLGLIFAGFLYLRGTRLQKVIAVLMAPPILLALSRTGSRSGELGAGFLFVAMLVQAKRQTRIRLLVSVPIVFLAILFLVPKGLRERYATFGGTIEMNYNPLTKTETMIRGTIGSAEARKQLLKDSLAITMRYPLLGVGPGNFQVEQDKLAKARGEKSMWHVTHNTYTEISSEMGAVGLFIYLALLFNVFKILNSIIRTRYPGPAWQNLRQLARTLRAAFIVLLPVAFFCSMGYHTEVPILAGLATALGFMAQKQRAIDRAASAEVVPTDSLPAPGLEPVAVGRY